LEALTKLAASCCKKKRSKKDSVPLAPPKPLNVVLPYVVEVPCRIQSQNVFTWTHWTRYAGYRKQWAAALAAPTLPLQGCRLDWSVWRIVRHYTKRQREFDLGNLVGGAKPVADSLQQLGVIVDDSPKHFKCSYEQLQDGTDRTVITLESITRVTQTPTEVSGV
jgi:hypothetical protein